MFEHVAQLYFDRVFGAVHIVGNIIQVEELVAAV